MLRESPAKREATSRRVSRSVALGTSCLAIAIVGMVLVLTVPWVTLQAEDPRGVQSASYGVFFDKTSGSDALPGRLAAYSSVSFDGGRLVPRLSALAMSSLLALVGASILGVIAITLGFLPTGVDRARDEAVRATPFILLAVLSVLPIHTGVAFLGHAIYRYHLDATLVGGGESLGEALSFPAAYAALGIGVALLTLGLAEVRLAYRGVSRASPGGA
jgi:hypothetical protein